MSLRDFVILSITQLCFYVCTDLFLCCYSWASGWPQATPGLPTSGTREAMMVSSQGTGKRGNTCLFNLSSHNCQTRLCNHVTPFLETHPCSSIVIYRVSQISLGKSQGPHDLAAVLPWLHLPWPSHTLSAQQATVLTPPGCSFTPPCLCSYWYLGLQRPILTFDSSWKIFVHPWRFKLSLPSFIKPFLEPQVQTTASFIAPNYRPLFPPFYSWTYLIILKLFSCLFYQTKAPWRQESCLISGTLVPSKQPAHGMVWSMNVELINGWLDD